MNLNLCKVKISHLIFIVICFVGCLYHVIKITEVYLAFHTKIDVSFDSQSQIVVPLVTFCKRSFALIINESLRQPNIITELFNNSTPFFIDDITFQIFHVVLFCRISSDKKYYKQSSDCQKLLQFQQIQTDKTINYWLICYNIQHPQFSTRKRRMKGMKYEFWLYHHHQSEFYLFLTSDNNAPNGYSENSLKLISKQL